MSQLNGIVRQGLYERALRPMKHRDIIFKENIDIKRVLSRGSMPFYTKIKQKVLENKKKISMFIGMMIILNLHPVYNYMLEYSGAKRKFVRQGKALLLGSDKFYRQSIYEQWDKKYLDSTEP